MESLRHYLIGVVAAAMACGILSRLCRDGSGKELIRLLCGLFLTVTVLRPLSGLDLNILTNLSSAYAREAEQTAAWGENMAREAMADIIKTESEAYILDKAAGLNANLTVAVTIGEDGIPELAQLSGEVSPYVRQQLECILESDLGITKENQQWTG